MATIKNNVFVGAETGLLKGVHLKRPQWNNLNSLECADKNNEICVMCWDDLDESKVCLGLQNRTLQVYDINNGKMKELSETIYNGGKGKFKGLCKLNNQYLTAVESGLVKLWKDNDDDILEIETGPNLACMAQNCDKKNIIATGGKESCLKIWDIGNSSIPIFKAKNLANDWLNLRIPIWDMCAQFLPGGEKVVTATGHHQVRVYDPKSSRRRPVIDVNVDEFPLTSMSVRQDAENHIIVGNTQGMMALVDLRLSRMLQIYKGFAGGVRDIKCHASQPIVASCGLDRHLRIHHIVSKKLIHKFYLKSRLNCLLFSSSVEEQEDETNMDASCDVPDAVVDVEDAEGDEDVEDDEDVWENLKVIKTIKKIKNGNTEKRTLEKRKKKNEVKVLTKKKKQK